MSTIETSSDPKARPQGIDNETWDFVRGTEEEAHLYEEIQHPRSICAFPCQGNGGENKSRHRYVVKGIDWLWKKPGEKDTDYGRWESTRIPLSECDPENVPVTAIWDGVEYTVQKVGSSTICSSCKKPA